MKCWHQDLYYAANRRVQWLSAAVVVLSVMLLIAVARNIYLSRELAWWRCERPYVAPSTPTLIEE